MRKLITTIMLMFCCIMLCSTPSNATSVSTGEDLSINVEAPFATISDFYLSSDTVKKKDELKYSFKISFLDSFDYNNEDFDHGPFRTDKYWVDVCWQTFKKQKVERTYECAEVDGTLHIEGTIPVEKGMQAGAWHIQYIRIANALEEGDALYFGDESEKDPSGYCHALSYYTDFSFTIFNVTGVNKKADNKAPTIKLNSLKISDRYVKKSKKKKKITFSVKIKDDSTIEKVECSWMSYDRKKYKKDSYCVDDYNMKYNKKTKSYQCTFNVYPKSIRKKALCAIYVRDIYGNEKEYMVDFDKIAPEKSQRKYYNAYKRMIVLVK